MNSNDKKQQILTAALKVIHDKGITQTSMREIASSAGMTTGAIYYYYKNKDDLFQDIIDTSIHFSNKIFTNQAQNPKLQDDLLVDIISEVRQRLNKIEEQRLHVALLSKIITSRDSANHAFVDSYKKTIKNTGDLFAAAFGIENEKYKHTMSAILIAALDGMALQESLGLFPNNRDHIIDTFSMFFSESIPAFLEAHNDN
jgi:AcrR family transcriptional regulator